MKNISYKSVIKSLIPVIGKGLAVEAARILFNKEIETGEGFDFQNELIESLPGDIGKLFMTGARVIDAEPDYSHISAKNCTNCEYFYIKAGGPRIKTVSYQGKIISMFNDANYIFPSCSCDLSDIDKDFECIQDIKGVFVVPMERTTDHTINKAQILTRQIPCTIDQALSLIDVLRVLELDYKSEQELLKSAKSHAKQGKFEYWLRQYLYLKSELEAVTNEFNMPEDFDALEISLEGIKNLTLDYQEPLKATFEEYTEAELNEIEAEKDFFSASYMNEFTYYRFDAIDKTPCAGQYAEFTSKKDLFAAAKAQDKVDYKAFYKRLEQLESAIDCPELEKALDFMRSGKIEKAKSLSRLKDYTYNNKPCPSWLTPDRLNRLWKEVKA